MDFNVKTSRNDIYLPKTTFFHLLIASGLELVELILQYGKLLWP